MKVSKEEQVQGKKINGQTVGLSLNICHSLKRCDRSIWSNKYQVAVCDDSSHWNKITK